MTELYDLLQRAILTAADTMDIWRDTAVVGLAAVVLCCLLIVAEVTS